MIVVIADLCPDPSGHAQLHRMREQTWREPVEHGQGCRWCGGMVEDTPGAVADDDLRAELATEARMYAWLERGQE